MVRSRFRNHRQLVAAVAGGIAATAIDVVVLATLVHAGLSIAVAAFAGVVSGALVCFAVNKYVAFSDRTAIELRQVGRFAAVALATAMLMGAAMELVAVRLAVPYLTAKVVCAAAVFVVWSYPAQRRFVFSPSTPGDDALSAGASLA